MKGLALIAGTVSGFVAALTLGKLLSVMVILALIAVWLVVAIKGDKQAEPE